MTLNEFVQKYNGKGVDYDKMYGYQCFLKDHCVLMADWTYKPIQDVRIGDRVIGYDNEVNTVTGLYKHEAEVIHIKTDLSDLYCTPDHPFYFTNGKFMSAVEMLNHKPAIFDKQNYKSSGLTDEELLFLGFWLGDGNIGKYNDSRTPEIRITYGEKKADFVRSLGIISAERQHHDCENAYVGSIKKTEHKGLSHIILNYCTGEYKRLPLIFNNREYELILQGLIHADGSLHHNSYVITNTSLSLLMSMQAICIKLGYKTKSVRLSRRNSAYIRIKGKLVKSVKPLYRLTVAEKNQKALKDYAEMQESFVDTVYNLETDGTHTFICNNYKVHNCVDIFRQYCKDVLNIEHTGGVNGAKDLFLNYFKMPKEQKYFSLVEERKAPKYKTGDVLVWNATKSNQYGHVAILLAEMSGDVLVFEQNGFKQDGAKIVLRSRENLLGALRFYASSKID